MKRTLFLLVLVVSAMPVFAQSFTNEFGVIVGGSRRFIDSGDGVRSLNGEDDWIESNFAFGNNSIELYWSFPIEQDLNLKFKGGRIQSEIAIPYQAVDPTAEIPGTMATFRRDVADGQIHHLETVVEYEFDEPFGSSGLFAGLGFYRLSASGEETQQTWGVTAGVNTDFPITRRYGVVLEGSYHWTKAEFNARYLTLGGGLRVSF